MNDKTKPDTQNTSVQQIPIHSLIESVDNVRTLDRSKTADAELVSSIRANGLLQNLVVVPNDDETKFEVVAGGRRHKSLLLLCVEGYLSTDDVVPCIVRSRETAVEVSLSENVIRQDMSIADQFTAFKRLIDEGGTEKEVAAAFGKSTKAIKRIMRLANLHPTLFKHLKTGKLDLESAIAYAATSDQKRQLSVFNESGKNLFLSAHQIKRLITQRTLSTESGIVKFVGLKAYKKAGGQIEEDLFSTDKYALDTDLLVELAGKRLSKHAESLIGWKWITTSINIFKESQEFIQAEKTALPIPEKVQKEHDALKAEYEAVEYDFDGTWTEEISVQQTAREKKLDDMERMLDETYTMFSDEVKAVSGCLVGFDDQSGELVVLCGLQRPEDVVKSDNTGKTEQPNTESTKKDSDSISFALSRDLGLYRRSALVAELATNLPLALDVLYYETVCAVLDERSYNHDRLLSISLPTVSHDSSLDDWEGSAVDSHLSKVLSKLETAWINEKNSAKRFEKFQSLSPKQKHALVAYAAALQLETGTSIPSKSEAAFALETRLDADISKWWRPTIANYFKRISKGALLDVGKRIAGKTFTKEHSEHTKKQILEYFETLFESAPEGNLSDTEKQTRLSWLPIQMKK